MTIQQIDALIEEGNSLKQIARSFSEIANLKIKRIRAEVLRNRVFFEEMSLIYGLVRKVATQKGIFVAKPKKRISLILTSKYRFYGNINAQLINFFVSETSKIETDRMIIGTAAIDYFKAAKIFSNYHEVELKTDQPTQGELDHLIQIIKDYQEVLVFYSKLKTLLLQQPTVTNLTASIRLKGDQKVDFRFIFEPELPKILAFFDSQILTLLLEATFLESELSRTASRFISMDQAESEANKFIKEYENLRSYTKRSLVNGKILENFASLMAVSKRI
ncbi:F0F1 ATP synthase subunit gamma [Candidatus Daviesbacteria bacterium]|nr:F0F1 ATP synthase subunit gamma [Candidatus Daviesbacteria bacterium]